MRNIRSPKKTQLLTYIWNKKLTQVFCLTHCQINVIKCVKKNVALANILLAVLRKTSDIFVFKK